MHSDRVVSCYLKQNEDCIQGDSISDSSEKLLQREGRKVNIYVILVKGEFVRLSTYLCKSFLLVMRS